MSKRWQELTVDQKLHELHDDLLKTTRIVQGLVDHRDEVQGEIGELRTDLTHLKVRLLVLEHAAVRRENLTQQ